MHVFFQNYILFTTHYKLHFVPIIWCSTIWHWSSHEIIINFFWIVISCSLYFKALLPNSQTKFCHNDVGAFLVVLDFVSGSYFSPRNAVNHLVTWPRKQRKQRGSISAYPRMQVRRLEPGDGRIIYDNACNLIHYFIELREMGSFSRLLWMSIFRQTHEEQYRLFNGWEWYSGRGERGLFVVPADQNQYYHKHRFLAWFLQK
jgi:hypothetical protein